ncbi:MAG: hypothetical protein JNJ58_01260 [Chitinophagaceae bacterium]|nr:hypothetical protein [Chitinophagaceae bacterium]
MKSVTLFFLLIISSSCFAGDDPGTLIRNLNKKFKLINDYTAQVYMQFDIPGVKMKSMNGKVFYKQPDKFRIKAKGIFFLPKQNPMQQVSSMLLDTMSYTSVISGYETIQGKNCAIVNIIPLKNTSELILGKFWIDLQNPLVYRSQITTRNSGTLDTESFYSDRSAYALPEKVIIHVEVNKIKVPKMMAADLNKKSKPKSDPNIKEKGTIILSFSNYKINTKLDDEVFIKED